jgi:hypothetical protein
VSIAIEEQRIRSLFDRVETVEAVAKTLPEDDERRAKLLAVSNAALAEEGTIRPVIAAMAAGAEREDRVGVGAGGRTGRRPAGAAGCCWMCGAFMRSAISSGTCGR